MSVFGQKQDYIWVLGDSNQLIDTTHGGITIDFNQNPVKAYYHYRKLNMFICNASICDPRGRLIAYTNGCDIADSNDEIMENGGMINPGYAWQVSCNQNKRGYASGIQSALILALPEHDSIYYLFHKQMKLTTGPVDAFTEKLLYSIIDSRYNNGLGKVTDKNVAIVNDTLAYGMLIAARQANGKDWWLLTPKRNSNTFYIF